MIQGDRHAFRGARRTVHTSMESSVRAPQVWVLLWRRSSEVIFVTRGLRVCTDVRGDSKARSRMYQELVATASRLPGNGDPGWGC